MDETQPIVNRVERSPLVSIDLADYMSQEEILEFDMKEVLYQGLILREKEFRAFVKQHDWSGYAHKNVRLYCSADAIVPIWAYMLITSQLQQANLVVQGNEDDMEKALVRQAIERLLQKENLKDAKVVIKGCGDIRNNAFAYTEITRSLLPLVASLMYGEPCSTVPIYKRPRR